MKGASEKVECGLCKGMVIIYTMLRKKALKIEFYWGLVHGEIGVLK